MPSHPPGLPVDLPWRPRGGPPAARTGEWECPGKSDVLHEFLAFPGEQMIHLNKEKQVE